MAKKGDEIKKKEIIAYFKAQLDIFSKEQDKILKEFLERGEWEKKEELLKKIKTGR